MLKFHFVLTWTSLENHSCENENIDVAPNPKHVQIFVTKWQLNVHQALFSVPQWTMLKQPWGLTCLILILWTHLQNCGAWSQQIKGYCAFPNYIKLVEIVVIHDVLNLMEEWTLSLIFVIFERQIPKCFTSPFMVCRGHV